MLDRPECNQIHAVFNGGMGHYDLRLPEVFEELSFAKLKKLFTIILRESYENQDFLHDIDAPVKAWLQYLAECEKERWHTASVTFQNEYKDTSFIWNTREKASIKRNNEKMMREVKAAKKAYEGYQKRLDLWKELKDKFWLGGHD